jgi:hypothetical protein
MTPLIFEAAARGAKHSDAQFLALLYAGGGLHKALVFAASLVVVASLWKMFEKAGRPGWLALIPIVQLVVLLKIVGRPAWWVILYAIPVINAVLALLMAFDVAKAYGKDWTYALGLIFLPVIVFPILGFGSAEHGETARSGQAREFGVSVAAAMRTSGGMQQLQQQQQMAQQQQQRGVHVLGSNNGMSNAERLRQQMAAARIPASVSQQPLSAPPQSGAGGPIRGYRPKAS